MRGALRARTEVQVTAVEVGGGLVRQRVHWTHSWPVVLRPTGPGPGGGDRVHLVHAAGGPLGGDDLALSLDLGPGAALAVHSAGATLVQPGAGAAAGAPARWVVTARVAAGGRLHWAPEPTVVSDGAALESTLRVDLAAGATATVREMVVLGRHRGRGGRYTGGLEVVVDEVPLLVHTTVLDGADAGLCGPAGSGGARAVGTLVRAGGPDAVSGPPSGEEQDVRWAWSALDGPGAVLLAVGTPAAVTAVLDRSAGPAGPGPDPLDGRTDGVPGRGGTPGSGSARAVPAPL